MGRAQGQGTGMAFGPARDFDYSNTQYWYTWAERECPAQKGKKYDQRRKRVNNIV